LSPTPAVLTLDPNDPICPDCAKALGGVPQAKVATVSVVHCRHCGDGRACVAVRDYAFPAQVRRHAGKPWEAKGDELAELLGGRKP
jgi:hypothetical protein